MLNCCFDTKCNDGVVRVSCSNFWNQGISWVSLVSGLVENFVLRVGYISILFFGYFAKEIKYFPFLSSFLAFLGLKWWCCTLKCIQCFINNQKRASYYNNSNAALLFGYRRCFVSISVYTKVGRLLWYISWAFHLRWCKFWLNIESSYIVFFLHIMLIFCR